MSARSTSPSPSSASTYRPKWLLDRRERTETALATVVADCYLAGVSTHRMDKIVKTLGIDSLSKSQVSRMAADLNEHVDQFRHRTFGDAGPFTFAATGVNADGRREVLGMRIATSETASAWNQFLADLAARGLTGVRDPEEPLSGCQSDAVLRLTNPTTTP